MQGEPRRQEVLWIAHTELSRSGAWRFVVSHPSAIRLRKDGAPSVFRRIQVGRPPVQILVDFDLFGSRRDAVGDDFEFGWAGFDSGRDVEEG